MRVLVIDRSQFGRYVQEALGRLYDYAYLQAHPLAALIAPAGSRLAPGHALHRELRAAIDGLKPPPDAPQQSPGWRAYRCLCLRYQEMLTMPRVAEELGISPRQCRRTHHDALEAVVAALWKGQSAFPRDGAAPVVPGAQSPLQVEAARLAEDPALAEASLPESVAGAVGVLGPLAGARGVELSVALPPGLPPLALGRAALRQALLAALHHAVDWVEAGHVALSATDDGRRVVLSVVARRRASGRARGAGDAAVGARLEVARQLVEPIGGTIAVESGAGSLAIAISLPVKRPITILVVDDNPDARRLFGRYLGVGGYRVLEASNGEDALSLAAEARPDVITLDVMMPGQDGWEVLQTLRGHPAIGGVPVVVCTVLAERDLALALGAAEYLPKPVSQQQLLQALERCVAPAN